MNQSIKNNNNLKIGDVFVGHDGTDSDFYKVIDIDGDEIFYVWIMTFNEYDKNLFVYGGSHESIRVQSIFNFNKLILRNVYSIVTEEKVTELILQYG